MSKRCDTCKWLVTPTASDYADNYRVCVVPVSLPANMHFWGRRDLEEPSPNNLLRAVTLKMLDEPDKYLQDCPLHEQAS